MMPLRVGVVIAMGGVRSEDFGEHARYALLPRRQHQAEGGLQPGGVQARVVRAPRRRRKGAGGHGRHLGCFQFNSWLRLPGMLWHVFRMECQVVSATSPQVDKTSSRAADSGWRGPSRRGGSTRTVILVQRMAIGYKALEPAVHPPSAAVCWNARSW